MRKLGLGLLILFVLSLVPLASAQDDAPQDAEGCKDSPLIARFPGSHINSCENKEFEQAKIPVGKDADGNVVEKTVEGEYHYWDIGNRDGLSDIQVFRNFEAALKSAGFKIVYEDSPGTITANKGNTWIYLQPGGAFYYQTIVTVKAMQQEATADASSLKDELETSGHVAVYGIHFDTAKATITPDSEQTLQQIVAMLQQDPDLKLRIEGHTDNVGSAATNQALSEKRAQSVVAWLSMHGIEKSRLTAQGLGATKPVADNSTDAGRAKNRRVELVKM